VTVTYNTPASDTSMTMAITSRAINNENSGSASDLTEAPDQGTYVMGGGGMTLRMSW